MYPLSRTAVASPELQFLSPKNLCCKVGQNFALVKILQFLAVSGNVAVLLLPKLCNSLHFSHSCSRLGYYLLHSRQASTAIHAFTVSLIARQVLYLSQLAFRYLSQVCWSRDICEWFEQIVEIFTLRSPCSWLY